MGPESREAVVSVMRGYVCPGAALSGERAIEGRGIGFWMRGSQFGGRGISFEQRRNCREGACGFSPEHGLFEFGFRRYVCLFATLDKMAGQLDDYNPIDVSYELCNM